MFKTDACDFCGDCLTRCLWIKTDKDQAVDWIKEMMAGRHTPVVDQCITCYACNEICPQQANPFDLIAELQEKYHRVPKSQIDETEARLSFSGELRNLPRADRIMSTCVFGKTDAHLIQGELYALPQITGKPFFCWILLGHMGAESVQKRHAQEFVDRLAATGAKEIVCFHDDCYAMLAGVAPEYGISVPFRPIHLSEYLVEYLSVRKEKIQPLNMKIAYQRPCASRWTPQKEHFIDKLFELCGVTRVERTFDRKNAMCCAAVKMMLGMGDPRPDQKKNITDAKSAGAEAMVCLCPMCIHSLHGVAHENHLPLIFLGDLARMSLGEMTPPNRIKETKI
ncbi:MAG: (Fe-S)-binding protein [Desulfobacterales bacterium]|jgi:Fe-S oxidoreductase|nr:(Fe-S)-binding protein [Desulfobacterales bacterium]